jgi:hypothetical protein
MNANNNGTTNTIIISFQPGSLPKSPRETINRSPDTSIAINIRHFMIFRPSFTTTLNRAVFAVLFHASSNGAGNVTSTHASS